MPTNTNNIPSSKNLLEFDLINPLRGKGIKQFKNNQFILNFIGDPVWRFNNVEYRPETIEAFEKISQLYLKSRNEFLDNLRGHFAISFSDLKTGISLAASDRIGVHRLYWHQTSHQELLISNSLAELKSSLNINNSLSSDALYCYMYFHMVPTPYSIYSDINKLPPGHVLISDNGDIKIKPYWLPEFEETTNEHIDSLSQNLHHVLKKSVRDCLSGEQNYATFLSGGLDSSTVTGVASQLGNEATHSYSIGFDAKEYDETPFARETAKHFSSQHHAYYVTPEDVVNAVPKIATAYDEPFGNSSAVPTYYCAKIAAENGAKLMLAGDGGDELFAGNTRYASQRHYRHYLALPKVLRKALFDHIINALPKKLPLATKAQNYIKQAGIPLPDRLQIYNFLHRHDPCEIFDKNYLETVNTDIPLNIQREQYARPENASELNRMLYLDWQFTLADNDLRKVGSMCELAGINVAYPLLTDELISFSCKIPSELKLKKGQLRYFFRYAMQEFLCPITLNKSKHGFGLPFGVWLKEYQPLRELAQNSLEQLKKRHYFNSDFIDKVGNMHKNEHAGYYGELIWVMMMLELWLSSHS